jgi:ribosome-associated protein
MDIKFKIENDYIELNKLLKVTGLCATGGLAKIVIDHGCVKVDGKTEYRKGCKIRKGQRIDFKGEIIEVE